MCHFSHNDHVTERVGTRTLLRRAAAVAAVWSLAIGLLALSPASPATAQPAAQPAAAAVTGTPVQALADLSQFRPGNIISDAVFFDSSTMTEAQIASFLRQRVPSCQSGYVCLKDFSQTTQTRAADAYCRAYQGGASESAARIILKVAQACGINPQVLLVTLQKEQGLVTHTWPSDWRYTIAMGQGCPDTAACDTRYYGFHNQVLGAARQFRVYGQSTYFTWYAPGKTWNVLYNPNHGCGSSPVRIENQATANLYYYTPYQPNAAALRAGYGEGDGCSSYGNRNFFNYFTDWFGSTQTRASALVRASGRAEVYLVANGQKHHVQTSADLSIFESRLGGFTNVPARYVDELPTGKPATRYVHDPRRGALYLLQADGTKHWLSSEALITRYGYAFSSYVDVEGKQIDAFAEGTAVGDYFRADGSVDYYKWQGGTRRHIVNDVAWAQEAPRAGSYVPAVRADVVERIPRGLPLLADGTLVKESSSTDVFITGRGSELVHLPRWSLADDAGLSVYRVVPDGTLSGYTRAAASFAPIITCTTGSYAVNGGGVTKLTGEVPAGPRATIPDSVCSTLRVLPGQLAQPLFLKSPTSAAIYYLDDGKLRHVQSVQRVLEIAAGSPISQATWSAQTLAMVEPGLPVLADGGLVSFGTEKIYLVQQGRLRHVPDVQTLIRVAGPSHVVQQLPAGGESVYTFGDPLPAR